MITTPTGQRQYQRHQRRLDRREPERRTKPMPIHRGPGQYATDPNRQSKVQQSSAEVCRPQPRRRTEQVKLPLPLGEILIGDAETRLAELPTGCIDTIVTSPPYHLLRRYQAGEQEIGTERQVDDYVNRIVKVCDQLARVLRPAGTLWLNLVTVTAEPCTTALLQRACCSYRNGSCSCWQGGAGSSAPRSSGQNPTRCPLQSRID